MFPDELDYLNAVVRDHQRAGSFMWSFCDACLRADGENYAIIRPALFIIMHKYPARPELLKAERSDRE
jgi:hypothetical protein